MWAVIGAGIQILLLLLTHWFKAKDEKKEKMKEILKGAKDAKTASDVTSMLDRISSL